MSERSSSSTDDERTMRRVVPQRTTGWARRTARGLQKLHLTPNMISVASVVIAAIGCAALIAAGSADDAVPRALLLLLAALCAPLRLLANMLDGMLAVEGGMSSPVGDLYNELPDRLSDLLFLAGAGYAATQVPGGIAIGWIAASLAVLTAYVRSLGAAQGLSNHFEGPMSKPRRMWVLVLGCLLSIAEPFTTAPLGLPLGSSLVLALAVIALGSLATVVVRLKCIARDLENAALTAGGQHHQPPGAP
ncbi:CDP-alcohol phosphatidyltransferase family protein [Kocuria coralli]|uniref:CDP-alcohol phosphatidyltransferase family protein n=1 Tax=Kocuria coralli TaxID=1461025 RepID=A0A5J5KY71_9MICC|nr:CDP-alcohol phosphatidyltransferase family protein [Kocuria coralli]KAA9394250.1 CDP-alcohol phosphatidyltransferase family protein [Kocuria coralli]